MSIMPVQLRTLAATIPAFVLAKDSFFSLYRVQGTSMEPSLQAGDVLLVRKFEMGAILEELYHFVAGEPTLETHSAIDRARNLRYEEFNGSTHNNQRSRLYDTPPIALPGHVVVFKDPNRYPPVMNIKRVIGVSGQAIRESCNSSSTSRYVLRRHINAMVPPYFMHVEGDNASNSLDSRQFGPVTKNLLVGVAELVVWPPSRWKRIQSTIPVDSKGQPRSYWP